MSMDNVQVPEGYELVPLDKLTDKHSVVPFGEAQQILSGNKEKNYSYDPKTPEPTYSYNPVTITTQKSYAYNPETEKINTKYSVRHKTNSNYQNFSTTEMNWESKVVQELRDKPSMPNIVQLMPTTNIELKDLLCYEFLLFGLQVGLKSFLINVVNNKYFLAQLNGQK